MRPLRWYQNAATRTLRALSPRLVRPDDAFARDRLTPGQYRLYRRMDPRDRDHAVKVTRILLERSPDASDDLVRAALLHDVGKSLRPYRLWERIAVHLYAPADIPAEPRLDGLAGAWQLSVHHARYGAELVRRAGEGERVASLIAQHDADAPNPDEADPDARTLRAADELT